MNATVDIGLGGLLAVYLLLFIPLWFNWRLKLGLNKELLWTVLRMSVQLLLVGYYLEYLFRWNRPGLNLLWLLVMLLVANVTTLKRSKLPVRQLLLGETVASLGGFGVILLYFMLMILQVKPWYDAAYLIPVGGMILGNTMRSNVIALERFYNGLHGTATGIHRPAVAGRNSAGSGQAVFCRSSAGDPAAAVGDDGNARHRFIAGHDDRSDARGRFAAAGHQIPTGNHDRHFSRHAVVGLLQFMVEQPFGLRLPRQSEIPLNNRSKRFHRFAERRQALALQIGIAPLFLSQLRHRQMAVVVTGINRQ